MTQFLLTDYGNEQILQAIAQGTVVQVTSMVYGDGGGYQYIPQRSQSSLVNQIGKIDNIEKRYDDTDGFIYFSGVILANSTPCTIRELGLLDNYNKLLAIGTIPDTIKPEAEDNLEVSLPISMGFKTSIGEIMTVYVNGGSNIFANISLSNLNDAGKAKIAIKQYLSSEIFKYNDIVASVTDNKLKLFRSKANNNVGNPLTDTTKWEEITINSLINIRNNEKLDYWVGTREQYDAITTKDNNTIYNITNDTDITLSLLELLYPVGSIYIGTMATCPLTTLGLGTWQLVAANRVLQGADSGSTVGTTIAAGLPNIIGTWDGNELINNGTAWANGALYVKDSTYSEVSTGTGGANKAIGFDASLSNPIYGNSNTVQPPAYLVNIWERIA